PGAERTDHRNPREQYHAQVEPHLTQADRKLGDRKRIDREYVKTCSSFSTCPLSRNLRASFMQSPYSSTMIMQEVLATMRESAREPFPTKLRTDSSSSLEERRTNDACYQ